MPVDSEIFVCVYQIRNISYYCYSWQYKKGGGLKGAESSKELSASFFLAREFFPVHGLRVFSRCVLSVFLPFWCWQEGHWLIDILERRGENDEVGVSSVFLV